MNVLQKGEFKRGYKRLHENQLAAVNEAIENILANPGIGEQKKGDLLKFRVYKFPVLDQLYLLAYVWDEAEDRRQLLLGACNTMEKGLP